MRCVLTVLWVFIAQCMAYDFSLVCGSTNAVLSVAADNKAWIFHNGVHLGDIHHLRKTFQKQLTVHVGDVIYIVAQDRGGGYGVIADLIAYGQHCVTRPGYGPWRAMSLQHIPKEQTKEYRTPSSNAKANTELSFPTAPHIPGRSTSFPYASGAQYVWAKGAGEHHKIFIRLEVSNNCAAVPDYATR